MWETAVWQNITGRKLVRRAGGSCRILRPEELCDDDCVVPEEMIPVDVKVSDDGHFDATPTSQNTGLRLYHRPDPAATQAALRDALPALYLSFRSRPHPNTDFQPTGTKPRSSPNSRLLPHDRDDAGAMAILTNP